MLMAVRGFVAACLLIQRAWAGSCSVPCTKPAATGPCFFREDVCPYPDGINLIEGAVEAIAIKYDSGCVSHFKGLMCSLVFPVCRQGVVSPVCWSSCTEAYEACGYKSSEAIAICTKFAKTQQVAPDDGSVYCERSISTRTSAGVLGLCVAALLLALPFH